MRKSGAGSFTAAALAVSFMATLPFEAHGASKIVRRRARPAAAPVAVYAAPPRVDVSQTTAAPEQLPSHMQEGAPPTTAGSMTSTLDRPSGFELGVRGGLVRRSLDFNQDIYGRLRALRTTLYVYRAHAAVYPRFRVPALDGRLGLVAGYERAFAGGVRDADFGSQFDAFHTESFVGVRFRHDVRAYALGSSLTVGRSSSGLDDAGDAAGVPDVAYSEGRASFDGNIRIDRLHLRLEAGFRVPVAHGQLETRDWFPRVGGYGMDAAVLASYPITSLVSADLSGSIRRYVLEMNSEPEDGAGGMSEIAGGAVDNYVGAYVGLSFAL